ncbi:TetR/AcrR family transcriptional regulator [Nostoc sp. CHAB 5784]|uniref:TetR/AcrR family transcriptional regulator n=1 Tax=Nostoc mirabile TaxID=2907820 RepID=UPI001E4A1C5A|nr:TetR/AcrR family transcriptional regulator [Nostoc mirabile]MCC5668777.1 TetR/AcrR family transcriptional regulator [Nostoc mirabile CHAB5784]
MSTKTVQTPKAPRGRQRNQAVHQAVLKAAYELLLEKDFAAVTIEGVAARAGTAKTTIYRWWPTKGALLVDAFLEATQPKIEFPNTGSPIEMFKQQITLMVQAYAGETGHSVASLIAAGQMDKNTAEAFRTQFLVIRRELGKQVLQKAIEQGLFIADLDPDVALDLLYGPIYFRLLMGYKLDTQFAEQLVEHAFLGLLSEQARQQRQI